VAADERAAFTAWARAHQVRLYRTAYLLCGDRGAAEDLTQEALIAVARRWPRLADQDPYGYARRTVVNATVSRWRRLRREVLLAEPPDRAADGLTDALTLQRVMLRDALARLTPKQRAVLVLRFYDDLSEAQTAAVLHVSLGTVKSQTNAALHRLRESAPDLADLIGRSNP